MQQNSQISRVRYDHKTLLSMRPMDLADWLTENFTRELPQAILSAEDMDNASQLLLKLANTYSYLNSLLAYAKLAMRETKRNGNREAYEDMYDRKEAIQNATESVKQQYAAVSRAVTIRMENNRELMMNAKGYI